MQDETTPHLQLPYIAPAQAQKHVTHNEALRRLDALVHLCVENQILTAPPSGPGAGQRHIIAPGATGAWSGHAGSVAVFEDGDWAIYTPQPGWTAWIASDARLHVWTGTAWTPVNPSPVSVPAFGINTVAAAPNRLAVKSDAALLSHDDVSPGSGDVRLVLNKQATGRTASLVFQTGFAGRCEFGCAGDDAVRLKVSTNGTDWKTALRADAATGRVHLGGDFAATDILTLTNATGITGYAQVARFNVWNTSDGAQSSRLLIGQQSTNNFFVEVADQANVKGNWAFQPYGGKLALRSWRAIPADVDASIGGVLAPDLDNAYTLGTPSRRWSTIHAVNGTISTSDARDKHVQAKIGDIAGALIDQVEPVFFRWRNGGTELEEAKQLVVGHDPDGNPVEQPVRKALDQPGERLHAGFLAQDVRAAMVAAGVDFGAWGLDDRDDDQSRQWLRPEQLIPILWQAVRELRANVAK
jgi:Protein of unknown function (DUF2793)/Chaperone of endosialidase